jgi:hypothetical protein
MAVKRVIQESLRFCAGGRRAASALGLPAHGEDRKRRRAGVIRK